MSKLGNARNDLLASVKTSRRMSLVRSRDTGPEVAVRRLIHSMGYRFRLHGRNLPGTPDIVFAGRRKVIFVHGCFWHGHRRCKRATRPATNKKFWNDKIDSNAERDRRQKAALKRRGWGVLVVWECETKDRVEIIGRIRDFLEG